MRVRRQDENGDMMFGHGSSDIWRDVPDAVGQVVLTRLMLFSGEWFLDLDEGTNWGGFPISDEVVRRGLILGGNSSQKAMMDLEIKRRIFDTPGVRSIIDFSSTFEPNGRRYRLDMKLDTIYGASTLSLSQNIISGVFSLGSTPLGSTVGLG